MGNYVSVVVFSVVIRIRGKRGCIYILHNIAINRTGLGMFIVGKVKRESQFMVKNHACL